VAIVRERILEAKRRGATVVLNSHQLTEVERVCDRIAFIEHGRLTRTETLRGEGASALRAFLRTDPSRAADAALALSAGGIGARAEADGRIRLPDPRDESIAEAVRLLAVAGFPVYEVHASADLEELFRAPS